MLKALSNVAPRHLLDRRLNPPAELRAAIGATVDRPPDPTDRPKVNRPKRRPLTVPLIPVPVGDGL
jgi:hypothetical protein